jgi:hypothetical protein
MFEHYSGKTRDTLVLVAALAKQMAESDLCEAEVYLPFSGGDVVVRMKRQSR